MSELKDMPVVTVEQVHRFREAVLARIAELEERVASGEVSMSVYRLQIAQLEAQQRAGVPDAAYLALEIRKMDGSNHWPVTAIAERIVQWLAAAPKAQEQCVCGESETVGVTHRTDGPCYQQEPAPQPAKVGADEPAITLHNRIVGDEVGEPEMEMSQAFDAYFHSLPHGAEVKLYAKVNGPAEDRYKAELYDEVWQKARDLGYGNVTMALEAAGYRAERSPARAQLTEVGADERAKFEEWVKQQPGAVSIARYPDDSETWPGVYCSAKTDHLWLGWQARAQLTEGAVTDDMRAAVRWAPSSAYWSQRLIEFFGPDAREGIAALEKQMRDAQAALTAAGGREELEAGARNALQEIHAMFPLDISKQQFVIAGMGSPLRADGDDEFYSAKKVDSALRRIIALAASQPAQE